MNRWQQLDTDKERLPSGMVRIGYDADTQIYTYRDADGSIWEGAPGAQYGAMRRVSSPGTPPSPPQFEFCRPLEPRSARYDPNVEDFLAGARANKSPPTPEKDTNTPPELPPRRLSPGDPGSPATGSSTAFSEKRHSISRKPLPRPLSVSVDNLSVSVYSDTTPTRTPSTSSTIRRKPVSPASLASFDSSASWTSSVRTISSFNSRGYPDTTRPRHGSGVSTDYLLDPAWRT